jgi:hypothetical protein
MKGRQVGLRLGHNLGSTLFKGLQWHLDLMQQVRRFVEQVVYTPNPADPFPSSHRLGFPVTPSPNSMTHTPGILLACKDKSASSSSLKIEALSFLRAGLEANPPSVFKAHVQELSTGGCTVWRAPLEHMEHRPAFLHSNN